MSAINMQLMRTGRLRLYCNTNVKLVNCMRDIRLKGKDTVAGGVFIAKRNFSITPTSHSDEESVIVNVENGVRKIVMNRPAVKNAMSFDMMDKLGNALYESNSDSATKIITITGAGDFYSSGNDFKNSLGDQTFAELKEKIRTYAVKQLMGGFINCRKPIIALVNGGAVGAAVTMLPFCDQVLASDKAFFLTPFTSIGVLPEFCSSYTFPKIMGHAKANAMLLFGHKLSAKEAVECGLITKIFPVESFVEECQKRVDEYSKLPVEPLLKGKELIRAPEREKLRQLCVHEMDMNIDSVDSPHARAMVDNFFSRKK